MFTGRRADTRAAFWDDYELITVCLPKHANETGTHRFWVTKKDDVEAHTHLTTLERHEDAQFFYFKLYVEDGTLEFGKNYMVVTECGYKIPLVVGRIVRTTRFDEQFYTDVELGSIYSESQTVFRVWAPTASDVILSLYASGGGEATMLPMLRRTDGVYELVVEEDCEKVEYHYVVHVNQKWVNANDPYAQASTVNGERSVVVNMRRFDQAIQQINTLPEIKNYTDAIIYEMSVRDFTTHPAFQYPGKYLGLTERGVKDENGQPLGLDYIADLGVTHVQLMPIYDFGSVDERENLENQYNWGYDPNQYNVPEGSYATNPCDPFARILELKQMIAALHNIGVRVNMDVVYNHVYKEKEYSFSKIVPYYYYRYLPNGDFSNATGCGNDVASERRMVRRFIIDSVLFWQKEYQIDGFRFDLMGILDVTTMRKVAEKLRQNDNNCMVYGEGWDMPTALDGVKATMFNHEYMENIAYFNDYYRDVLRGSNMSMEATGFLAGNPEKVLEGMNAIAGSLGMCNERMLFDSPQKTINYIECHDNHTLYDRLKESLPNEEEHHILAMHRLGTALVLLSQGIAFLHSGQEMYRTKKGVENSYNAPIDINRFDWNKVSEHQNYVTLVKSLIRLRKQYPLFRLKSSDRIVNRVKIQKLDEGLVAYEMIHSENHFTVYMNVSSEQKTIAFPEGSYRLLSTTETEMDKLEAYSLSIYHNLRS